MSTAHRIKPVALVRAQRLAAVRLNNRPRPRPQVLLHELTELDFAQKADALAVTPPGGGQAGGCRQRAHLRCG